MIWFTSDTHFGHANIVRLCNRPFHNVHEMDETLIKNWNEVVHPDDVIYVLGDFAYKHSTPLEGYADRLNGHKHLILGNHDRSPVELYQQYFESVQDLLYLSLDGIREPITLLHYPMLSWKRRGRGAWHLYGHVHRRQMPQLDMARAYNVGVDANAFVPISLEQLKPIMKQREVTQKEDAL